MLAAYRWTDEGDVRNEPEKNGARDRMSCAAKRSD